VSLRFASYLAARKGCELVVALSHRLADLAGRARILVAGQGRMWSDYSGLMRRLHPAVAEFVGWVPYERLPTWYRGADAVLVPSHYEPFALTLAEALACGTPVLASDTVGAAEWVGEPACVTFASGDLDALEQRARALLGAPAAPDARAAARAAAERRFAAPAVLPALLDALRAAGGRP
jgi:glycogen(starch) synthase